MSAWSISLTEAAEQGSSVGVFNTFEYLMILMLVGVGLYGLYSAIRLYRQQILFPNKILYPGNCDPENCLDAGGFIDYIVPRMLIFSILLLLSSVPDALNKLYFHIDWLGYVIVAWTLGLFIWYIIVQNRAYKRFW